MSKEYKVKILKNGEKRYIFDVNIGYRADGSRIRKTVTAKTIKDGRKRVSELMLNTNNKVILQKNRLFSSVYDLYITDCKKRGLSINTINLISNSYRKNFHRFENTKIDKIKETDLTEWSNDLANTLSNRSIRNREDTLNTFFNWCVKRKFIEFNPFVYVNRTKYNKPNLNFWTESQFNEFLKVINNNTHKLIFTTLFYTGLRKGEFCGLSINDLDINHCELHLSHNIRRDVYKIVITTEFKNEYSKRIVPIPVWLCEPLRNFMTTKKYPFKGYYTNLSRIMNGYIAKTDLPHIRVHDLRHSYVSMLINKNVDIYTISRMVGHNDIKTTINIYGDLYPDKRKYVTSLFGSKKE